MDPFTSRSCMRRQVGCDWKTLLPNGSLGARLKVANGFSIGLTREVVTIEINPTPSHVAVTVNLTGSVSREIKDGCERWGSALRLLLGQHVCGYVREASHVTPVICFLVTSRLPAFSIQFWFWSSVFVRVKTVLSIGFCSSTANRQVKQYYTNIRLLFCTMLFLLLISQALTRCIIEHLKSGDRFQQYLCGVQLMAVCVVHTFPVKKLFLSFEFC